MLPYALTFLRTIVAFGILLAVCRLIGQPFKVVSGVAAGALAALTACYLQTSMFLPLFALVLWSLLSFAASYAALKSMPIRNFVNGKATPLVQNGKVLDQNLKTSRLTVDDMMALLRKKNAFKVADVEFASLEGDGTVSVLMKSDSQPITPRTQNLAVENEGVPGIVILDGQVLPDSLANHDLDRAWLFEQISLQGAKDWSDVFLAQVDAKGNVYVDLYDDLAAKPTSRGNPKAQVLVTLKKIQADLESFALQTENREAKVNYEMEAHNLKQLIAQVTPYLRQGR